MTQKYRCFQNTVVDRWAEVNSRVWSFTVINDTNDYDRQPKQ